MVPFLLGQRSDAVDVGQPRGEIGKIDLFFKMMVDDDLPAGPELALELAQKPALHGWLAAAAGNAFLFGQSAHNVSKIRHPAGNPFALVGPGEARLSEKRKPILVVDDDDAIRTMVERVLRREQFEVESARDGFEAIEKLTRNDYATVLLDLMMPRVDGHGVLRFLEQHPAPAPVIVMTANMQGGSEAAEARPVFRVLSKPFDISQLIEHVRQCAEDEVPV